MSDVETFLAKHKHEHHQAHNLFVRGDGRHAPRRAPAISAEGAMTVKWIDAETRQTITVFGIVEIEERDGHIALSSERIVDWYTVPLSTDLFCFGQTP